MNTLMIKDLSNTAELDGKAMSAVRGGNGFYYPMSSSFTFAPMYAPNNSKTVTASQLISSTMNIQSANGNNSALVAGTTTTIDPTIQSNNNISVY